MSSGNQPCVRPICNKRTNTSKSSLRPARLAGSNLNRDKMDILGNGSRTCALCALPADHLHHDGCSKNKAIRTARHNSIAWSIIHSLRTVKGLQVTSEPPIEGSPNLRNDIRLVALDRAPLPEMDIDLTVRNLTGSWAADTAARSFRQRLSAVAPPIERLKRIEDFADAITEGWRRVKHNKIDAIEGYERARFFRVLPISLGGYCDKLATKMLDDWKKALAPWSYTHMCQTISCTLVKARAVNARRE
jgi:hypothetical protein